ncbi:MAG: AsmA-like C-terminal region-containing protein, partial [Steroidobacteraceae bacterium]
VLDGMRLRPVAGLPAIGALRGTLAFAGGHLQRSTVTGTWLGGPITLSVGERRGHGATALAINGHGLLNVRAALLAATGVTGGDGLVHGDAEWSAELRLLQAANGRLASWSARADSNLVGVTSGLPEPFAKTAAAALALRLELAGSEDLGQLRPSLGARLRGLAAVKRRGELWQIERGAVSFGAPAPVLPAEPEVLVQGTVSRLDLPGYALLWRQLTHNAAWPALQARLQATELFAGGRSYPDVTVLADSNQGVDRLRLESADLAGEVRWPGSADGHPASAHLARLNVPALTDPAAGAGLIAALGPTAQLSIDDLQWQGRSLGAFTATVLTHAAALDVTEAHLAGTSAEAGGTVHCQHELCHAEFSLDSHDASATLASLGFRGDLGAARGHATGDLQWASQADGAALATAEGRLHIELDDGVARSTAVPGGRTAGTPLGLLAVPALLAGMGSPPLRFSRLTADFAVHDGQAATSDLHVDGDAEILMRGRIGLAAQDYDAQVWVLKGEQRLPAAVRAFGPTPKMAALWLSLRELFAGAGAGREHVALRLRGTWNAPIVTAGD